MAINKNKVMEGALKLVEKGAYDKAVKEYLKVVQEDPKDVRVWLKIGDLYAKKGSKQEATETYLKVSTLYSEQGFYLKAVAVYKQILKIDPRLIDVNLKLAALYRQLQLPAEAMAQFEQVATFCHREGKPREAVAALQQILEIDPSNVATRIKLAELYSKEGQAKEAIEEFSRVAANLRAQGRTEDFIKVAERLVWHQPDNRGLNRELAELYIKRGDPRRALQKLQACFKADPRDVETLILLAGAFEDLGQTAKTTSVLKELARIHQENGTNDKRLEVLRRIQALAPDDTDVRAVLGTKSALPTRPGPGIIQQVTFSGSSGQQTGAMPIVTIDDGGPFTQPVPAGEGSPLLGVADAPRPAPPMIPNRAAAGTAGHRAMLEPVRPPPSPAQSTAPATLDELSDDDIGEFNESSPSRDSTQPRDVFAEEVAPVRADDFSEEVAKTLAECDVYVKYGLHQKAIDHVRPIIGRDPKNLEAHEKLKEIYLKLGRTDDAASELAALVEITGSARSEVAAGYLQELTSLAPGDARARALADRFALGMPGREAEAEAELARGSEPAPLEQRDASKSASRRVDPLGYGDEFSDEMIMSDGDEDAGLVIATPPLDEESGDYSSAARSATVRATTLEDGGESTLEADVEEIISVVEIDEIDEVNEVDEVDVESGEAPLTLDGDAETELPLPNETQPVALEALNEEGSSLEDDLDEADFFVQQNLYGEARSIFEALLQRYPNHPLVQSKLADLDSLGAPPAIDPSANAPASASAKHPSGGPPPNEMYQLSQHRQVVAKLGEEDVETHYDLGIAYKEMGLFSDAIKEFQVVMQLPARAVQCAMMVGLCYAEINQHTEAINQFKSALYEPQITEREALALYFELGQSYERLSDGSEALYYYEKVAKRDPRFREVGKRISSLRERLGDEELKPRNRDADRLEP